MIYLFFSLKTLKHIKEHKFLQLLYLKDATATMLYCIELQQMSAFDNNMKRTGWKAIHKQIVKYKLQHSKSKILCSQIHTNIRPSIAAIKNT